MINHKKTTRRAITFAPALLALALLLAMLGHRSTYGDADDAMPYHRAVKTAVEALPYTIDVWQGTETHVPQAALALIRPNAISSRRYVNQETGRAVDLLVVQCRDARDMAGHYPPVCYPAHGWRAVSSERDTWSVAGNDALQGMVYQFDRPFTGNTAAVTVANLLVLPDGRLATDMKPVRDIAADYTRHIYGAAQVQIVFYEHVDDAERRRVVELFLEQVQPVIKSVWGKKPS